MLERNEQEGRAWPAHEIATLVFVFQAGKVLLIEKLRGVGKGKVTAPGGHVEEGETVLQAAFRELQEEVHLDAQNLQPRGLLRFTFKKHPKGLKADIKDPEYRLLCHVCSADGFTGELQESEEARPFWVPLSEIPYAEMWEDDAHWLPLLLAGRSPFEGNFTFEDDQMLAFELKSETPEKPLLEDLEARDISFQIRKHPPVFTVEDCQKHRPPGEKGLHTKNFFLYNSKNEYFLVSVQEDREFAIKAFQKHFGLKRLSFASDRRLEETLQILRGSVSPLALYNDKEKRVKLYIDEALLQSDRVWLHPLTNDRSLSLAGPELQRWLGEVHAPPEVIAASFFEDGRT